MESPNRKTKLQCTCVFLLIFSAIASMGFATIYYVATADNQIDSQLLSEYKADKQLTTQFKNFAQKYHKYYLTNEESDMRFIIFSENYQRIKQFNSEGYSFKLAVNFFADLTEEEYESIYLNNPKPTGYEYIETETEMPVGDNVDIDYTNKVGRVKDQGTCGSCWSFAASGAMEFLYSANNNNKVLEFSEQQIVDCCRTALTQGCNGGEAFDAFDCTSSQGVVLESDYPYLAVDGVCRTANVAFKSTSHAQLPSANNTALLTRLNIQAIYIGVNAASYYWRFYSSGVVSKGCSYQEIDHAVLLVGAGTDAVSSLPYWKIKNSWGPNWGNQGFIYILREQIDGKPAQCAMNLQTYYPTFGKIN